LHLNTPPKGSKIVVAMSGGVDSSVVAGLLVEQGYSVVGMMLTLWNDSACDTENRCCTPESLEEARKVAGRFGFPFYAIDAKRPFFENVVSSFLKGYKAGVTPNPCLVCNAAVRWKILLNEALASGAHFLATGHYAKLLVDAENKVHLHKGVDASKDQSYVLSFLSQADLQHTFFPLGNMNKSEVREHARRLGLEVAEKPDSQDLCFLGAGTLQSFLQRHAAESLTPGKICLPDGTELGNHDGLAIYTIGQRKGIGVAAPRPLYVLEKDLKTNTLIVGYEEHLGKNTFEVRTPQWLLGTARAFPLFCEVKTRYKAKPLPCKVSLGKNNNLLVTTETPQRDITPGQGAVFYSGDEVLGSGVIALG
jgi:tRNA-specific 2-thiouridylase